MRPIRRGAVREMSPYVRRTDARWIAAGVAILVSAGLLGLVAGSNAAVSLADETNAARELPEYSPVPCTLAIKVDVDVAPKKLVLAPGKRGWFKVTVADRNTCHVGYNGVVACVSAGREARRSLKLPRECAPLDPIVHPNPEKARLKIRVRRNADDGVHRLGFDAIWDPNVNGSVPQPLNGRPVKANVKVMSPGADANGSGV